MALIKRTVKGSPLTFAEGDANLQYLEDLALGRINGEGTQGPQGTAGAQGSQGPRGIQGAIGSQGAQGTTGTQGAQGITGTQGAQGATGVQGSQGATGNQGISGSNGPAGTQGPQGIQGTQGPQGIQGTQGPQGDQINTNWNRNQEYIIRNTEQLTFSGDYILENAYLEIEGGATASIGEWTNDIFTNGPTGSITRNSNNQYTIIGPSGDTNGSNGLQIKRLFDTNTTMSVYYTWNGDGTGNDRPYYVVDTQDPVEPDNSTKLRDPYATSETAVWTINVPSGSWVAIGVWTDNINNTSGSLQITLPYLPNEDIIQYSPNKFFKKEGTIFIGGNLLVKDSFIENNGKISVDGEVILIGNSQIEGTGIII